MSVVPYIIGFQLVWCLICCVGIYRVNRVTTMRRAMLEKIFRHMDYEWRIAEYEKCSYDRMVVQFWKRIKPEAFYKDTGFIDGPSTRPVLSPYQVRH